MLEVVVGLGSVVVFAAVLLWSIEALAKRIGGKRTAVLLLGFLPAACGLTVAYLNRAGGPWWTFIVYPFAGPLLVLAVVVMGYLAVSPFGIPDVLGLIWCGLVKGYRALCGLLNSEKA